MTRPLLNLIEGSLYRSPLRLLEALQGERKRSWDLGYRHFKRYGPDGFDDSKAVDKAAYKVGFDGAREEASQGASQSGLREVSRASAVQTLKALPRGLLAGWFRNADRKYKAMLLNHIKKNPEVRNAGLNIMHQEYQSMTRSQVPFDEFMDTPIRMYRGGGSPADEAATSYSMDQKVADSFVDRKGAGLSVIEIKPRDTLGSYQTTAETEVLIPSWEGKDFMDGDPQFRGRSNYELQAAIGDTKAELRQDRSRLPELKARHGALRNELKVRAASGHQSVNPYDVDLEDERREDAWELGRSHRVDGLPRDPDHADVRHKGGYEEGYSSAEMSRGQFPQASWDAGHAAADAGELADRHHPDVEDPNVYLNGYMASMNKRPDPRTSDPNYTYTPANDNYYDVDPNDHIQLLIDRWQQEEQRPRHGIGPLMVPVHELWPHREYLRNPEHSRGGAEHWHQLKKKMSDEGWNSEEPLELRVGSDGGVKIGEGNHRLAISRELGVDKVPVDVVYDIGRVTKSPQSTRRTLPKEKPPEWMTKEPGPDSDEDPLIKELSGLF
jgi:hypothetical protein